MVHVVVALVLALQSIPNPFRFVSCGQQRCAAVDATGSVVTWGKLGEARASWTDTPQPVPGLGDIVQLAVGAEVSLALTGDGQVFAWGDNADLLGGGRPGAGPVRIASLSEVVQVAAGGPVAYALRRDGTVWAWGRVAQVAARMVPSPAVESVAVPAQVPGLTDVTAIASGFNTGLALTATGDVYAWGNNAQGDLGDGTRERRDQPVKVTGIANAVAIASSGAGNLAVLADGTVRVWGSNATGALATGTRDGVSLVPVPVTGITGAVAADGGTGHFVVLTKDGTIRTWGHGGWGETAVGRGSVYTLTPFTPKLPGRVVRVEAGGYNTYVTLEDGRILGIGLIYATPWDKYRTHAVSWQVLGPDGFTRPAAGG